MATPLTADGRRDVARVVHAPAAAVWAVVGDGWLYANWVVGASRVRAVDPHWPEEGSRLHHSFGIWPAVIDDESLALETDPGRRLLLQAKGWPLGEARIELTLADGPAGTSTVTIVEDAVTGPGSLVPRAARQAVIAARNREALRRLALIAEGRHREWTAPA